MYIYTHTHIHTFRNEHSLYGKIKKEYYIFTKIKKISKDINIVEHNCVRGKT